MINKRFLNFKTYAEFNRLNEAGEIRQESIVWIADTNQMWTHGTLYSSITEEQARKLAGILTDGAGLKYLTDKLTYEELPDQATVIDIDGKIMDLTTESSNEDILAVFGTLPDFTSLIETIRNSETILNSILVDNDSQVGKVNATILANKTSNTLDVIYFDHVKKTFVQLTITETEGALSCVREEFGSAGGGDTTPEVAITEAEPVPGSQEKVYYQVVEDNVDLGVDTDAPADGNIYGRKDNAWVKNVLVYDFKRFKDAQTTPDPELYKEIHDNLDLESTRILFNDGNAFFGIATNIQGANITGGDYIGKYLYITYEYTNFGNNKPAKSKLGMIELSSEGKVRFEVSTVHPSDVLSKDNTAEFTPTQDYHPATKKYVDEHTGDPTNVLILNYETDLANGQQSQPIDPSISAKLIDAVDTGKACVIKSGNSDILSNIQKVGTDVHIIMEQISKFEGSFIATNTTITVDTAGNTIKAVDTGAIELVDKSKVLAKDNSTEFTPSGDYNPATKKYIDDLHNIDSLYYVAMGMEKEKEIQLTDDEYNSILKSGKIFVSYSFTQNILYLHKETLSENIHLFVGCAIYNEANKADYYIQSINAGINKDTKILEISVIGNQQRKYSILTETEYSALGDTPLTDDVLYFVTPDA